MREILITEENIQLLVDTFYVKIRKDPKLGPIFNKAIGDSSEDWQPHLKRMYSFWSSVMLSSGRYYGNPVEKHRALPDLDLALFDYWLEIFAETAKEIYGKETAKLYQEKSTSIAKSLKLSISSYQN